MHKNIIKTVALPPKDRVLFWEQLCWQALGSGRGRRAVRAGAYSVNKDNSSVQGLEEILSGTVQTISILFYSPFTTIRITLSVSD